MTSIPIATQKRFHPTRLWRFDFAFPNLMIAIEIQGYGRGHADYMSMHQDYQRHNEAVRLGWKVYYFMGIDIEGDAIHKTIEYVKRLLDQNYKPPQKETAAEMLRRLHGKGT